MDAELYSRVRKLEKQVEALLERHPEVRAVLERGTAAMPFESRSLSDAIEALIADVPEAEWEKLPLDMATRRAP